MIIPDRYASYFVDCLLFGVVLGTFSDMGTS